MSALKRIREEQNLTQEELAEKTGLSVRTIQRVEAGTEPKGYTLKTLIATLNISEKDLSVSGNFSSEAEIIIESDETVLQAEKVETFNSIMIKIINLSSLPFAWFPVVNFLPPLLLMIFTKEKTIIVKQIISLQIFLAVICPVIFLIIAFLKLGSGSVMLTMCGLTLANVFIILRNTYEIDRKQKLRYCLNFNII